jgi:hypothetical protein
MNKEELKEKAEDLLDKITDPDMGCCEGYCYVEVVDAMVQFAEGFEKELEKERKINEEIKARFVKCNTCTDEMKSKCLMFTENLCEGERCEELVDLMSLVEKKDSDDKMKLAKDIIKKLVSNAPNTYSGTDIGLQQRKMFAFHNAVNEAEDFLKE